MPFFRRSAQRFFIAIDSRLLPSGVRPRRLRLFDVLPLGLPPRFLPPCDKAFPMSAEMARPSRSLSFFKSANNFSRSKVGSYNYADVHACEYVSTQYLLFMLTQANGASNTEFSACGARSMADRGRASPSGAARVSAGRCRRCRVGRGAARGSSDGSLRPGRSR